MAMDPDEVYRSVARALHDERLVREQVQNEATALRAELDLLRDILIRKGVLAEGHRDVLERAGENAAQQARPKVYLNIYKDKYQVPNSDVDCASLVHLCQARCCSFSFPLSRQDVEEGVVKWEIEMPYLNRREPDGWCTHFERATQQCTIHSQRPGTCRLYDCREDRRVWLDYEKRIPAPMPMGARMMGD